MAIVGSTNVSTTRNISPQQYGQLIDLSLRAKSVAAQASTVITIDAESVRFPILKDGLTASWKDELQEIDFSNIATDQIEVRPSKVAGISRLSNELAEDSSPAAADLVGSGLATQIAERIDATWFGAAGVAPVPSGIESLVAGSPPCTKVIADPAALTNLDPFVEARFVAEKNRAKLTNWIINPDVAKAISKLKVQTGSNQNLLEIVTDGLRIAGLPVLISPHVPATVSFYGIDREQALFVMRKGTVVERSRDSAFSVDGVDVRAIARVGWCWVNPAGVIRGSKS